MSNTDWQIIWNVQDLYQNRLTYLLSDSLVKIIGFITVLLTGTLTMKQMQKILLIHLKLKEDKEVLKNS